MSLPYMSISDNNRQNLLVTYAALTGLTPLVPIPFVDDQIYAYFLRSLVQRLAAAHHKNLNHDEIAALTLQANRGCALGCLGSVLLYPLKKVLRKIFFFLEWKRAVDTISHTYYQGYLIDVALAEGWLDDYGAVKVRAAINAVLAKTNTSVIARAILGAVNTSKHILRSAGELLSHYLSGSKRAPQHEVERTVAGVEDEEKAKLGDFIAQLQNAIAALPAEHFQQLRHQLATELSRT
jgi:hypothetical protein